MNEKERKDFREKLGICPDCLSHTNFKETGMQDGLKVTIQTFMGGLLWKFVNGNHNLSIICHDGSYGKENGLFEILPSWEEDVTGHLTFGEVQEYINQLKFMGKTK